MRLHELNCAEVNEGELGSMRAAAAAADWSLHRGLLYISLHPAVTLSHPLPFIFSFAPSALTLPCRFFLSPSSSVVLPPSLFPPSSLSPYIIDTEHIYESFQSPEI